MNKYIYVKDTSPITRSEAVNIACKVAGWVVLPVGDNKIMIDSGDYNNVTYEITKAGCHWGRA